MVVREKASFDTLMHSFLITEHSQGLPELHLLRSAPSSSRCKVCLQFVLYVRKLHAMCTYVRAMCTHVLRTFAYVVFAGSVYGAVSVSQTRPRPPEFRPLTPPNSGP